MGSTCYRVAYPQSEDQPPIWHLFFTKEEAAIDGFLHLQVKENLPEVNEWSPPLHLSPVRRSHGCHKGIKVACTSPGWDMHCQNPAPQSPSEKYCNQEIDVKVKDTRRAWESTVPSLRWAKLEEHREISGKGVRGGQVFTLTIMGVRGRTKKWVGQRERKNRLS